MLDDTRSPAASTPLPVRSYWEIRWIGDRGPGPTQTRDRADADTQSSAVTICDQAPQDATVATPRRRSSTRPLAWPRAYFEAGDPQAAAVCLCEVLMNRPSGLDPDLDHHEVQALAEDLAASLLERGLIDPATDLLQLASAWARGDLLLHSSDQAERTVITNNPLNAETNAPRPGGGDDPTSLDDALDRIFDEERQTTEVDHQTEETTAVFRSPFICP